MKALRELFLGLLTTVASTILVLGAILLALSEGMAYTPATPVPDIIVTAPPVDTPAPGETPIPNTPTPTYTHTPTATDLAPTTCPPPIGWMQYTVLNGDSLEDLAEESGTTEQALLDANCLISDSLLPGTTLYLPPLPPTPTPTATTTKVFTQTPVPCGPPSGWVFYIVQSGDTLFRLSLNYNVSVPQLQQANCLGNSTNIQAGQAIYVPFVRVNTPTVTPSSTRTRVPATNTPVPTSTRTPIPGTATFTFTPMPTTIVPATATPTTVPATATLAPTSTFTPSVIPTTAPTATATTAPPPTPTETPLPTEISIATPLPTSTP